MSINSLYSNIMSQTCLERFNRLVKVARFMASLCGADAIESDYRMSPITWTVIIAINAFNVHDLHGLS